jgi:hypothetical protein
MTTNSMTSSTLAVGMNPVAGGNAFFPCAWLAAAPGLAAGDCAEAVGDRDCPQAVATRAQSSGTARPTAAGRKARLGILGARNSELFVFIGLPVLLLLRTVGEGSSYARCRLPPVASTPATASEAAILLREQDPAMVKNGSVNALH